LALNPLLIVLFGDSLIKLDDITKYLILSILLFFEFSIITILIQKFFYLPIQKLEIAIKNFYL